MDWRPIHALVALALLASACAGESATGPGQVTDSDSAGDPNPIERTVVHLGNPTEGTNLSGRDQSVWDLQVYDGRLYIGGGNTTTNPGGNYVWSYDPLLGRFAAELEVNSEAVERYRVINDTLYVPASDPRPANRAKYWSLDPTVGWDHLGGFPELAHVRDMAVVGDKLLMVGNSRWASTVSGVVIADLDGSNMTRLDIDPPVAPMKEVINGEVRAWLASAGHYYYSIVQYQGVTLVTNNYLRFDQPSYVDPDSGLTRVVNGIGYYDSVAGTVVFDQGFSPEEEAGYIDSADFLPATVPGFAHPSLGSYFLHVDSYAENGSGALAYTLSSYSLLFHTDFYEDLYRNGLGLYVKTSLESTPILAVFPDAPNAVGEDVLLIDNVFYALAVEEIAVDEFVISVQYAGNPERGEWTELFSFASVSRAKSFAYLDDGFYFGLGADLGENASGAGDLLLAFPAF